VPTELTTAPPDAVAAPAGRSLPRGHLIALLVFGLIVAVSWWRPLWPAEQALHHSLTVLAVIGLLWAQRRLRLPLGSFVLVLAFLALHTVAARWIYSYVPYADWWQALFGGPPPELLGGGRNHFDRLVHFAYGLLLAPVLVGVWRSRGSGRGRAWLHAVQVVVSTGALYELFEWGVAVALAPDAAEAYNGQQGDLWDAQKDMALALLGAMIGAAAAHVSPVRPGRRGCR
jgi:putative membrane protein